MQICSELILNCYTGITELPSLKNNLKLTNSFHEKLMNIDTLLGKDFYHTFFTEGIISGKSNEPVELSCNSR